MDQPSRRAFLAGSVAALTASAGCLSGGSGSSDAPELGDIAATSTPETGETLPSPVAGDPDAEVTVAAYEDYACPHCATYSLEVFPQLASEYLEPGTIRYEFHDFPIPVDETASWQAASAARAVQAGAGDQAFFEYSEALFANQSTLGPSTYADLSETVDGETVRQAATGRTYRSTVRLDRQNGVERGVSGTPEVFVDGSKVEGASYDAVSSAIDDARSG